MRLLEAVKRLSVISNLVRYNTRWRIKDETVAEHSYFVVLIAMMISWKLRMEHDVDTDTGKILQMAVIHDLPECEVSDIPYGAKDAMGIRDALRKFEHQFFKSGRYLDLYKELEEQRTLESRIVKFADTVSVMMYAQREVSLGNHNFEWIVKDTERRLRRFDFPPEFDYQSIIRSNNWEDVI